MNQRTIQPGTRILFANFPADGHFNPLTGLAVHLKSIGCDVRWYTSKKYESKIRQMGIPFYGLKKALDFASNPDIDAVFPERKNHKSQVAKLKFDMVHAFILRSPEYFEDIKDLHQDFPFELMIADITFGGIAFVYEKMNIPVVGINVFPLPETSRDLPPAGLGMTPTYSWAGKQKQNILRFIADKILFAHPTRVMTKMLNDHGISTGGSNIFDILIKKSNLVLQSGTPGFEYKRSDISSHVHFVGPLLPHTRQNTSAAWTHEKLNRFQKVVLVTQGTVETDTQKLLIPTLEAFKNSDVLVVATTGGSGTEALRKLYPHDNIIIENFIPFNDIMPYADVYVTNGGYGGVLMSIQNGLPMVVAGLHEGKNEINARIGYFGLGVNLKTEKPAPEAVKQAVNRVLNDGNYAGRVSALREEFTSFDTMAICEDKIAGLLGSVRKVRTSQVQSLEAIY